MAAGVLRGPRRFFAAHPGAYGLSLLGAALAVAVFAGRALRATGVRRLGWAALVVSQVVQLVGIASTRRAGRHRRRVRAGGR
jgi:hypothetical protein